ncbi:frg1-like motif-containing protein [Pandoravirus inopinatum]|uniref:Frg1-like motif-containing protein n=1 Tax=Pandoravirus inopinatum TaxID=1605721 RepID=A0A0B5J8Z7_9VIRU|nr:frg1-like motif-containing protein [Pandoravirus inopinatum]AJF98440.1 frg1-like motif-containing protein [Pandoravirus inopinatum]
MTVPLLSFSLLYGRSWCCGSRRARTKVRRPSFSSFFLKWALAGLGRRCRRPYPVRAPCTGGTLGTRRHRHRCHPKKKRCHKQAHGRTASKPAGWFAGYVLASWEQWDDLINAGDQSTLKSVHGACMITTVADVTYCSGDGTAAGPRPMYELHPKKSTSFFLVSFVQPLFYSILSTCFLSSFVFIHCLVGLFVCGVVPLRKKSGRPFVLSGYVWPSILSGHRAIQNGSRPSLQGKAQTRANNKDKGKRKEKKEKRERRLLAPARVFGPQTSVDFFPSFLFSIFFLIFLSFLAGLAVAPGRAPGRVCQRTSLLPQKDRSKEKAKRRPITGKKERGLNHTKEHSTARLDRVLLRKKKRKK